MLKLFTRQQNSALESIRNRIATEPSDDPQEFLVMTGPLGGGMSTCAAAICKEFGSSAVALDTQSAEFSYRPAEWLSEYFGLFDIKCPQDKLSRSLIAMAKLVNLKVIMLEDIQDLKVHHFRRVEKIFDDLVMMRAAIPGLSVLITVKCASLPWLKSVLEKLSIRPFLIELEPLANDKYLKQFIAQHAYPSRIITHELLETTFIVDVIFDSVNGSIGRLLMMFDLLGKNIEESSSEELLSFAIYVADLLKVQRK
ncbi:hypothetical protein [Pseudomonas umsongensis]|uniref:hypothetical protein n=1 Tax=Pseudomonas umsongensis TaxID=198618 RepID=UPI003D7FA3C1